MSEKFKGGPEDQEQKRGKISAFVTRFLGSDELAKEFKLPRWFLYVPPFYFGLILVSTGHFLEHILAMIQRYVWNEPPWGLIGQLADREWLHVWYNVPIYLAILFPYIIARRRIPDAHKRDSGLLIIALFLAVQGYHVLEHVVKIYQYLTGGVEPVPGILGNWIHPVPLHFNLVFVTYVVMVLAFFRSEIFGYPRATQAILTLATTTAASLRGATQAVLTLATITAASLLITWVIIAGGIISQKPAATQASVLLPGDELPPAAPGGLFVEAAARAGVAFQRLRGYELMPIAGGTLVLDYNNDGLQDIYVVNTHGYRNILDISSRIRSFPNALYRNNGDGTFTDVAAQAGVDDPFSQGHGACAADYDNDGHADIYVTNWGTSKLFHNNGNGTFSEVTKAAGVGDPDGSYRTTGCAWGDYNNDGFLDLIVVRHMDEARREWFRERYYKTAVRPLALYRSNRDGTFANVTPLLGKAFPYPSNITGAGFQPGFLDYDNDGDLDIYVVNDFGDQIQPNVLWRNDGPDSKAGWRFTDVSQASGADVAMWGMSLAVGDYDNDRNLDVFMTNIGDNVLLRNRGNGTFEDATSHAGVGLGHLQGKVDKYVGWGAVFLDYDNDGFLDLYIARGYLDSDAAINPVRQPNLLLRNKGNGTFTDVSPISGANDDGIGRGVVYADFNNDGKLDLFLVNTGQSESLPGTARLFINSLNTGNHWLILKPVGVASNRDGIGARVTVVTSAGTQIREVRAGDSQMSQSMVPVHFGLGRADKVELVQIRWPSGVVQTLTDVYVDQVLTVQEAADAG